MHRSFPHRCLLHGIFIVLAGSVASAEDYQLQVVAFSDDVTDDRTATNRQFGIPRISNADEVMFRADWRADAWQYSVLRIGRPGSVSTIAAGGNPPAWTGSGSPSASGIKFAGGSGSRDGNFAEYVLNGSGEFWFTANVVPSTPSGPTPVGAAICNGSGGSYEMLAGTPGSSSAPPVGVANLPYTGNGRLQFSSSPKPPLPVGLSDTGIGFFIANVEALETSPTGVQRAVGVVEQGIFVADQAGKRLISHLNSSAPGLFGDYVFRDPGHIVIGQKNGAAVLTTSVMLRNEPQPNVNFRLVYYEYAADILRPFYTEGDPLPGLPPLSEVLGTSQPYDLRTRLVAVDETGNAALLVSASARNFIDSRPLGYWRKAGAGLSKILRFNEDTPTAAGAARFLPPSVSTVPRVAMGGGKIAFVGGFTATGSTASVPGIIREVEGGFEAIATWGLTVPGTSLMLSNDFATHPIWMNAHGEVAFFVSFRDAPTAMFRNALWVYGRDRVLRRCAYVGQQIPIKNATRTISGIGVPEPPTRTFSDRGAVVMTLSFTDGTRAIVRAVPPGYQDPGPPSGEYVFNGKIGNNWHSAPLTNWEDAAKRASLQAPGDADPNTARVIIPEFLSVLLDQRPAAIGSLKSDGRLMLRNLLTLNNGSAVKDLSVVFPNGGLNLNNSELNAELTNWTSGTLSLANSTFRNTGTFVAAGGTVAHGGGKAGFENNHTFRKQDFREFTFHVPFNAAAGSTVAVAGGSLGLLAGGSLGLGSTFPTTHQIAPGAVMKLAGNFSITGKTSFESTSRNEPGGTLELGTAQEDANLILANDASVTFYLSGPMPGQKTILRRGQIRGEKASVANVGGMVWQSGRIGDESFKFVNQDVFEIDNVDSARRFSGTFVNIAPLEAVNPFESKVIQRGSIQLDGTIENNGFWEFEDPADIRDPNLRGTFINRGALFVNLQKPGIISINAAFTNMPLSDVREAPVLLPTGPVDGILEVGNANILDSVPATVNLRGPVFNLSDGVLSRGLWLVQSDCVLTFPSEIHTIAPVTIVSIRRGSIPSLNLATNEGELLLEGAALAARSLVNRGKLELSDFPFIEEGGSTLTVDGSLTNSGTIECGVKSKIDLAGEFKHEAGHLHNDGEIYFSGTAFFGGTVSGSGKFIVRGEGRIVLGEHAYIVDGGGLLINGGITLSDGTTFAIRIGSGPRLPFGDVTPPRARAAVEQKGLTVTRTLELGGNLQVNLDEGFQPPAAEIFVIAEAAEIRGNFANVASGQRVTTADGRGSFQVFYGAGSPHGANTVVLTNWQPSPAGFPLISTALGPQTITAGDPLALSVTASGAGTLGYQWRYRGVNIPGATNASYTVPSTQRDHAGLYSVVVTNAMGSVVSSIASITVASPLPSAARLANVSTRALVRDGNEPLIPGFVVQGTSNARLLIRAVGPALGTFGVEGALPNPQITVKRLAGSAYIDHASNNDWSTNANAADIAAAAAAVGAFPLSPGALDSALLLDLAPGQYTVVTHDIANRPGVAIVELYNLAGSAATGRLANISTRAYVGTGTDVMIPGFVVSPEGSRTLLVRAVGPTLGAFGVEGVLADPQLTIYQRQPDGTDVPILSNNDWSAAPDASDTAVIATRVGAFALPAGSKDAALVATLSPGAYTVHVSGVGGTTGNALVEVYVVP